MAVFQKTDLQKFLKFELVLVSGFPWRAEDMIRLRILQDAVSRTVNLNKGATTLERD